MQRDQQVRQCSSSVAMSLLDTLEAEIYAYIGIRGPNTATWGVGTQQIAGLCAHECAEVAERARKLRCLLVRIRPKQSQTAAEVSVCKNSVFLGIALFDISVIGV